MWFVSSCVSKKSIEVVLVSLLLRGRLQISSLLSEFKGINSLQFPLKSSENLWFCDGFRGNRNY